MNKVIFWNSSAHRSFPSRYVGPHKISNWLNKNGYKSVVIDFVNLWSIQELEEATCKLISKETKVIAISTTFLVSNPELLDKLIDLAAKLKDEFGLKIILGGHGSEFYGVDCDVVDYSVQSYEGKSEDLFLEVIKHIFEKEPQPFKAIGYKNKFFNAPRNSSYDFQNDEFGYTKHDFISSEEALPLDISRGCIFSCKFCRYLLIGKKKNDHVKDMKMVESELIHNYDNFGTTKYYILCDTFNDSIDKIKEFYEMTQRLPFKIKFSAYLRLDLLSKFEEAIFYLKESGLVSAHFGIETFHPKASMAIGKGWNGKQAKDFLIKLREQWPHVALTATFIVGLPGENEESIKETVNWVLENNFNHSYFLSLNLHNPNYSHKIFNKSEFEKNPDEYGYTFPNKDDNSYWENDIMNFLEAKRITDEANEAVKDITCYDNWSFLSLLQTGYTEEYAKNTPIIKFDRSKIDEYAKKFLKKYKSNFI